MDPAERVQKVRASNGFAVVSLPESPTSGYLWELEEGSPAAVVERSLEQGPPPGVAGGGGFRTFRLKISQRLPATVCFVLRRPWEAEPLERRTFEIVCEA
jgi:predicted secreted protein